MTRFAPIPDPGGQLVPPSRRPPTAVGTLTPPAPEFHRRSATTPRSRWWLLEKLVTAALDYAGEVADRIRGRGKPRSAGS